MVRLKITGGNHTSENYELLCREYENFVKYLPDALIEIKLDFNYPELTYMNRMAHVLFQYTREDLQTGIPVEALFIDTEEFDRVAQITRNYAEESVKTGQKYTRSGKQDLFEVMMKRKTGQAFPVEAQASMVLNEDEIPVKLRVLLRDISERKRLETEREHLIQELTDAAGTIKKLKGLLPICASCKNIRDDKNNWHPLEAYFQGNSDITFSHGLCPECLKKLYGMDAGQNGEQ